MVQEVLKLVCSPPEAHHGMRWAAGKRNLFFYADDGRIAGRDHECVQDALTVTMAMFFRIEMEDNLKKTKAIVYTPRFI